MFNINRLQSYEDFIFGFYDQTCFGTMSDSLVSDDVTLIDGKKRASNVDKMARKGFPLAFLLFNFIYWMVYTVLY